MAKKYIVTNCPSIHTGWRTMYECFHYNNPCKECTTCLIKQVIEKCKSPTEILCDFAFGQRDKADVILQLFEIEEVNNDK